MYSVRTPFFGTGCTSESTTRTAMCSAATSCSRVCVSVIVVSALRISSLLPHLPETNSAMSFPCGPSRFGERPHPLVKEAPREGDHRAHPPTPSVGCPALDESADTSPRPRQGLLRHGVRLDVRIRGPRIRRLRDHVQG